MKTKIQYALLVLLLLTPLSASSQESENSVVEPVAPETREINESLKNELTEAAPVVYSVQPLSARKNVPTTFTVRGANLPNTLTAWMENCGGLRFLSRGPTEQTFFCTFRERFLKDGAIFQAPGGGLLYLFEVRVR